MCAARQPGAVLTAAPRGPAPAECAALEEAGVKFKKRPHEGRMRNLAFAYDPDGGWGGGGGPPAPRRRADAACRAGYWIEIIPKGFSV